MHTATAQTPGLAALMVDHYASLGIPIDTDFAGVQKAHRQIVRVAHPDLNSHKQMTQIYAQRISLAYSVLSRPVRRQEYDLSLRHIAKSCSQLPNHPSVTALQMCKTQEDLTTAYQQAVYLLKKDRNQSASTFMAMVEDLTIVNLAYLVLRQRLSIKPSPALPKAVVAQQPQAPKAEVAKTEVAKPAPPKAPQIFDTDPDLSATFELGKDYLDLGHYSRAITCFIKCLRSDSANADTYALLGLAYLKTKKLDLAQANFRIALRFNPEHPLASRYLKQSATSSAPAAAQTAFKKVWSMFNSKI
jgi:curved DNA-binding protein CbpA